MYRGSSTMKPSAASSTATTSCLRIRAPKTTATRAPCTRQALTPRCLRSETRNPDHPRQRSSDTLPRTGEERPDHVTGCSNVGQSQDALYLNRVPTPTGRRRKTGLPPPSTKEGPPLAGRSPSTVTRSEDQKFDRAYMHQQGQELHESAYQHAHTAVPAATPPPRPSKDWTTLNSFAAQNQEPVRALVRCHEGAANQEKMQRCTRWGPPS